MSLAQFRPEKDHKKQLEAFAILLKEHPEMREGEEGVKLVMMGGVRDEGDQQRLEGLKKLATELNIEVSFCPFFFTGKSIKMYTDFLGAVLSFLSHPYLTG